jgi:serine/threonine protein phosphatase PrpC
MSLAFRSAAVSDLGLVRSNNEDAVYAGRRLVAVADGIGGAPAGELASELVIQALAELDRGPEPQSPLAALGAAVAEANREIGESTAGDLTRQGMGTTVTALLLAGDRLALLHVGDSRGYLLRSGTLSRLTRDDTFVQALVDSGMITAADARAHPQRSIITQAVQGGEFEPTGAVLTALAGDRYLLCSDGLSDYVDDEVIGATLGRYTDPQECARQLVELALRAGAPDNVTVVVCDVVPAAVGGGPGVGDFLDAAAG